MTARHWAITDFEVDTFRQRVESCQDKISYIMWSLEKCPSTGRLHQQGFITLKTPLRRTGVQHLLSNPGLHLEKCIGGLDHNMKYVSKSATHVEGPWEIGTPVHQGTRTDLKRYSNLVIDLSNRMEDVALENPHLYIKYPRGSLELRKFAMQKKYSTIQRDVKVILLIGDPGVGKTKYVYDRHPANDIHKISHNDGQLWFDGYDQQKVLLLDDFKGSVRYTYLLQLLDRYPMQLPVKGSFTWAAWEIIYITSNYSIRQWYNEAIDIRALERRICETVTMSRSEVEGNTNLTSKIEDNFIDISENKNGICEKGSTTNTKIEI